MNGRLVCHAKDLRSNKAFDFTHTQEQCTMYSSLGDLKSDGKAQCSSGMRYRNVEFLVSILYYSPAVVQPRKPFVQEISRKKDRTVFQCPPYIFPYILSPYVMHVLYR